MKKYENTSVKTMYKNKAKSFGCRYSKLIKYGKIQVILNKMDQEEFILEYKPEDSNIRKYVRCSGSDNFVKMVKENFLNY
jgi:hypothetical protein